MKWTLILLFIVLFYVTVVEPNILTVKSIMFKDASLKGLKIVYASDFHLKPYDRLRLRRIVDKINAQSPDMILLGGDYVSGHKYGYSLNLEIMSAEFSNLKSKYGTAAVMGNHDGWQGRLAITEALESAGIKILDNESILFHNITIAGIEDIQTGNPNIEKALKGTKGPVILLSHSPDIIELVPKHVDLTLAGHTHGGQVVLGKPLIVPSRYGTRYAYGRFEVHGRRLFVSRGLGTSILPLRFNCFPEIVVINFI